MLRQQRQCLSTLYLQIPAVASFTPDRVTGKQGGGVAAYQHHRTMKIFRRQAVLRYRFTDGPALQMQPPLTPESHNARQQNTQAQRESTAGRKWPESQHQPQRQKKG